MIKIFLLLILFLNSCTKESSNPGLHYLLEDWNGKRLTLNSHLGKVILLDFWASWCEPCEEAAQVIEALSKEFPKNQLIIYGINTDSELNKEQIKKAALGFKMTYTSLLDPNLNFANLLKVEGQPAILIFNKKGSLLYKEYGLKMDDLSKLRAIILQEIQNNQ